MTPRGALAEVEGVGYHLTLRPGGLRLTGPSEPPPGVVALIREHRGELMDFLEAEARAWEAHEASLAAGRVTHFPAHLQAYLHPSIRHP